MNEQAATFDMDAETTAVRGTKPVVVTHDHAVTSAGDEATPMGMLDRAVASGASIETLDKLFALQERWEASKARKAFNEAFAAFKAEAVTVVRNRKVTDGPLKGRRYAELVSFVEAATPALSRHGLSASWDVTRDEESWIEVTCTIEHVLGGNKSVSLGGPPDTGGAKNPLQARISTVTYLERATFKAACGLAEQGDDNDGGKAAAGTMVSPEQVEKMRQLIMDVDADLPRLLKYLGVERLEDIYASKFDSVMAVIESKRGAKK